MLPARHLLLLAAAGWCGLLLAAAGCYLLPAPACFWLLPAPACCWLLLAAAGCCWLPNAGCCWLLLPDAACQTPTAVCCWLLLAGAGCCWLLPAAACCCLVVKVAVQHLFFPYALPLASAGVSELLLFFPGSCVINSFSLTHSPLRLPGFLQLLFGGSKLQASGFQNGPFATAKQHLIACRNRAQTYPQRLLTSLLNS